jgi:hypothetical protein
VRDLFDADVAVRAGKAFVRGPFFELFVAIETVVRQDGGPDGGTQDQKDDDKNRHNIPHRASEIIKAFDKNFLFVGGIIRNSVLFVKVILATNMGCGTDNRVGYTSWHPAL